MHKLGTQNANSIIKYTEETSIVLVHLLTWDVITFEDLSSTGNKTAPMLNNYAELK
jgi:hypothetical protein